MEIKNVTIDSAIFKDCVIHDGPNWHIKAGTTTYIGYASGFHDMVHHPSVTQPSTKVGNVDIVVWRYPRVQI